VPVGIRLRCEVCGEESVIATPAARARFGLLECPVCETAYLVLLASIRPATRPTAAAAG
jgi:transcription elongation factor Elf1